MVVATCGVATHPTVLDATTCSLALQALTSKITVHAGTLCGAVAEVTARSAAQRHNMLSLVTRHKTHDHINAVYDYCTITQHHQPSTRTGRATLHYAVAHILACHHSTPLRWPRNYIDMDNATPLPTVATCLCFVPGLCNCNGAPHQHQTQIHSHARPQRHAKQRCTARSDDTLFATARSWALRWYVAGPHTPLQHYTV